MKSKVIVLMLLAGGSLFGESRFSVFIGGYPGYYAAAPQRPYWVDRQERRQDLREDYRDVQNDYAQVERLRADIARDRYRLNEALENGNEWQASRIAADLARDQRALAALQADIDRDHRDIRRDQRELDRGAGYWRYR
jgi:septal ring factor EnvC (AmiA/AmiB activator)